MTGRGSQPSLRILQPRPREFRKEGDGRDPRGQRSPSPASAHATGGPVGQCHPRLPGGRDFSDLVLPLAAALAAVWPGRPAAAADPPTRWPRQATPALEHAVLAYALLWPTHGPARIAAQLRQPRWGAWRVSASGVYGILKRHGLQTRWERLTRLEARALDVQGLVTERTRRRWSSDSSSTRSRPTRCLKRSRARDLWSGHRSPHRGGLRTLELSCSKLSSNSQRTAGP